MSIINREQSACYIPEIGTTIPNEAVRKLTSSETGISERKIAQFCNGCQFRQTDNSCQLLGLRLQTVVAEREICAVARMNDLDGKMVRSGFILLDEIQ